MLTHYVLLTKTFTGIMIICTAIETLEYMALISQIQLDILINQISENLEF